MQEDSAATPPERFGRFFGAIEDKLADGRKAYQRECRYFFHQLEPRLAAARELDRELNHHLAHRFNVFRYLRDDELGLSRVIADLLDPQAAHGQGPQFLRLFLDGLSVNLSFSDTELSEAKVVVERPIEENRRIDIYVEISSGGKRYCLAIENKPYAGDQYEQVKDYLKHLAGRFDPDSFHLIYLSPTGEPPSEESLPKAELKCWHGRLLIMPYHDRPTDEDAADSELKRDEFREFRAPCSLTQWLANCRAQCEAQRLRWFLGDAESYCRRSFGDTDMASDFETKTVLKLLKDEPSHLETAQVVYESWPIVRNWICERFLNHLGARVKARIEEDQEMSKLAPDLQVKATYEGDIRYSNALDLHRPSWSPFGSVSTTLIRLQAEGKGPWDWAYGVRSSLDENRMSESDKARHNDLAGKLNSEFSGFKTYPNWPAHIAVRSEWKDWDRLAVELHRECKKKRGPITDYYVETLVDFAQRAIPIINKVEGA